MPHAKHVLALGIGGIVGALGLFLVVDVLDVLGSRTALGRWYGGNLRLWVHLYENGGLVEWMQWGFLAATTLLAASMAGREGLRGAVPSGRFWGLLSLAAVLMLIEDAGDPRHRLAGHLVTLAGGRPRLELAGQLVGEGVVFGFVAAPALVALAWIGSMREDRAVFRLLLGGYAFYAVAALSSFLSSVRSSGEGWYHAVGAWVDHTLLGGRLIPYWDHTGFWLMDRVYEESLELAGATLLCAAVVAYRTREPPGDRSENGSLKAAPTTRDRSTGGAATRPRGGRARPRSGEGPTRGPAPG